MLVLCGWACRKLLRINKGRLLRNRRSRLLITHAEVGVAARRILTVEGPPELEACWTPHVVLLKQVVVW